MTRRKRSISKSIITHSPVLKPRAYPWPTLNSRYRWVSRNWAFAEPTVILKILNGKLKKPCTAGSAKSQGQTPLLPSGCKRIWHGLGLHHLKNSPGRRIFWGQHLMGGLYTAALVWTVQGFSRVATLFGSTSTNQPLHPVRATGLQPLQRGCSQGAAWTG